MPSNDTENIYSSEYGGNGEPIPASKISYDNTDSGLQATKVQGAIDEVNENVEDIQELLALPSDAADGTYVLKATVTDGTVTYAWVAEV